ncbi:MAG TPA: ABC transporter ATP-binding protein [Acetobacteraceae bacterium]|jgi:iron complex transport system ATP-binding protein|nr:ABC transporter ATP-binding protein [Acetobacteraceae bacterium]
MIEVANLSVRLGKRWVLDKVNFSAASGQLTALAGPNGAGKSTLLKALCGLLPGTLRPDPRRVAYLAQGARAFWGLTVEEIVSLGRIPHGDQAREPVARALALCGIAALAGQRIDRLSGGEARRAMLARVFATEPEAMLLDEPTADLDPAAAFSIMRILQQTARAGSTVIVVLHAIELALRYADRLVVMDRGRIIEDGAPLAALPAAASAFGLRFGRDGLPHLLPE